MEKGGIVFIFSSVQLDVETSVIDHHDHSRSVGGKL